MEKQQQLSVSVPRTLQEASFSLAWVTWQVSSNWWIWTRAGGGTTNASSKSPGQRGVGRSISEESGLGEHLKTFIVSDP